MVTSEDQPATSAPTTTTLANRYGGQKRAFSRKAKRNIGIAGLAAGMAFMAWISTSLNAETVTFKDIGYSTTDATQSEIDFQVTKAPAIGAKCAVKALDDRFAVVGWKVVDVGPNPADASADGGRTTVHRAVVRTESLSVSGVVDSCWIPDADK